MLEWGTLVCAHEQVIGQFYGYVLELVGWVLDQVVTGWLGDVIVFDETQVVSVLVGGRHCF